MTTYTLEHGFEVTLLFSFLISKLQFFIFVYSTGRSKYTTWTQSSVLTLFHNQYRRFSQYYFCKQIYKTAIITDIDTNVAQNLSLKIHTENKFIKKYKPK